MAPRLPKQFPPWQYSQYSSKLSALNNYPLINSQVHNIQKWKSPSKPRTTFILILQPLPFQDFFGFLSNSFLFIITLSKKALSTLFSILNYLPFYPYYYTFNCSKYGYTNNFYLSLIISACVTRRRIYSEVTAIIQPITKLDLQHW